MVAKSLQLVSSSAKVSSSWCQGSKVSSCRCKRSHGRLKSLRPTKSIHELFSLETKSQGRVLCLCWGSPSPYPAASTTAGVGADRENNAMPSTPMTIFWSFMFVLLVTLFGWFLCFNLLWKQQLDCVPEDRIDRTGSSISESRKKKLVSRNARFLFMV